MLDINVVTEHRFFGLPVVHTHTQNGQRTEKTHTKKTTCTTEIYPEEKDTEQELDVEGDSGSSLLFPRYIGMRDLIQYQPEY